MIIMSWDEWADYESTLELLRDWRNKETYLPKCRKINDLIAERITDDIKVLRTDSIIELMFSKYATDTHYKKDLQHKYLFRKY